MCLDDAGPLAGAGLPSARVDSWARAWTARASSSSQLNSSTTITIPLGQVIRQKCRPPWSAASSTGSVLPRSSAPLRRPLKLRVLLDQIALEVFVGDGRHVVTKSVTPAEEDLGLAVFAEGGELAVPRMDAWTMKPAPITYRDELAP